MSQTTASAITDSLQSPNESDTNGETANVVDGLYYLGRSINRPLVSHRRSDDDPFDDGDNVVDGLLAIAEALHRIAAAAENANRIATGQPFMEI